MAVESGADLIDFCLKRYQRPTTDSTARANVLAWLNEAQRELWAKYPHWFRNASGTLNILAGTDAYTVSGAIRVNQVLNNSGVPLAKIPLRMFEQCYRISSAAGTPLAWTEEPYDATTGILNIRVRPIPYADFSAVYRYDARVSDMTDNDSSVSAVPEEYRRIMALRAMELQADQEGRPAAAQLYKQEWTEMMQAAAQDSAARNLGAY